MISASKIKGFGHYVPERIVPNSEIESFLNLEKGWIESRSGIRNRRYADEDKSLTDIALPAAKMALLNADIDPSDIGLLLLATSTPDHLLPPSAPLLSHKLGLNFPGAVDITGACSGFLYALSFADSFVRSQEKPAIIVAANILSRRINHNERASTILFGDAAGAIVLIPERNSNRGLLSLKLCSDGSGYNFLHIPVGGTRHPYEKQHSLSDLKMHIEDGPKLFSRAVKLMTESSRIVMDRAGVSSQKIDHFIPHQANKRMFDVVTKTLGISMKKVRSSIFEYGNSSAATIPLTLSIEYAKKPFKLGETILFTAAGAGMTGGAALWQI